MKIAVFDNKDSSHPYGIKFLSTVIDRYEVYNWCLEHFGPDASVGVSVIIFRHEADRNWFILRWS